MTTQRTKLLLQGNHRESRLMSVVGQQSGAKRFATLEVDGTLMFWKPEDGVGTIHV